MAQTTSLASRFPRLAVLAMVALAGSVVANARPALAVRPDEPEKTERPKVREQLAQREAERKAKQAKQGSQANQAGQAFGGQQLGAQVMSMVAISDGDKSIRIRNGVPESATVEGKEFGPDQIKREGNDFVVADKDGKEVARFEGFGRHAGDGQPRVLNFRDQNLPGQPAQADRMPGLWATPKVMIGVQMAQPSAELAGHFGIKPGDATLVSFVHKDTPADAAGLKQYDIILQVENEPASPERVRKAVQAGKPGDELSLKVLHRGVEKALTLKLAEYDPTKLSDVPPVDVPVEEWLVGPGGERLGRLTGRGGAFLNLGPDGVIDDQMRADIDRMVRGAWKDFNQEFGLAPGQNPFIIIDKLNDPAGAAAGEADDRMARLEERLEKMEQMLRDMVKDKGEKPAEGKEKPAGKAPGEKHTMIRMPATIPA